MPVAPTYPGVYVEEVPSGVRTIVGVATSVAAFIGFFARGPMNKAVRVLSFADFERQFGGLHRWSEASYAIKQFFLNGGTQAYVVRVAKSSTSGTSQFTLRDGLGGGDPVIARAYAGVKIGRESFENPGSWGDRIRLEVDYDTTDPGDGNLFNLTVVELASGTGRFSPVRTESYRNITFVADRPNSADEVINEQSKLIQLDTSAAAATVRPPATGTLGNPVGDPAPADIPDHGDTFNVDAGSGDQLITIDYGAPANKPDKWADFVRFLQAGIRNADPNDPLLSGAVVRLLSFGTTPTYRFHVLAGRTAASWNAGATLTFSDGSGGSGFAVNNLGLDATPNVQQYSLGGGSEAATTADLPDAAALRGSESAKSGIHALRDVDIFNILSIPRAADLGATDAAAVIGDAEEFCREQRAFLIVDIPKDVNEVADMESWMSSNATLRSSNAAIYFPRPRIADPLNGNRLRSVGASGTIAGLYARTDSERGVWKAPAGTDAGLSGAQALDYVLTDAENGVLNPIGVNCLRNFDVHGLVSWGARTLDGADVQASEWKYVPVRRLALFMEESLYRGTKWVVFEPNDEPLWAQIRLNVGAFMNRLFRQGAFQGGTPREAYFVRCDADTTTQDDINQGIVNILVGFAPLKPAEFVIIKISQIAGDIPT